MKLLTTTTLAKHKIVLLHICHSSTLGASYCLAFKKVFWSKMFEARPVFAGWYKPEMLIEIETQMKINPKAIEL